MKMLRENLTASAAATGTTLYAKGATESRAMGVSSTDRD